jgi:hypothetical protein
MSLTHSSEGTILPNSQRRDPPLQLSLWRSPPHPSQSYRIKPSWAAWQQTPAPVRLIGPMLFDTTVTSQVSIEHTGDFQHLLWQPHFIQVWHADVNQHFPGPPSSGTSCIYSTTAYLCNSSFFLLFTALLLAERQLLSLKVSYSSFWRDVHCLRHAWFARIPQRLSSAAQDTLKLL